MLSARILLGNQSLPFLSSCKTYSIPWSSSPPPLSFPLWQAPFCKWNYTVRVFHDWLISLSIIPSRFIHIVARVRISFLFTWIVFHYMYVPRCPSTHQGTCGLLAPLFTSLVWLPPHLKLHVSLVSLVYATFLLGSTALNLSLFLDVPSFSPPYSGLCYSPPVPPPPFPETWAKNLHSDSALLS